MARGRMILNKIGKNREVNDLSSDTSRLAYTWAIPHLDREGRIHGDPCILRNTIFPRREDVTPAMMRQFVAEWAAHDLVVLYEVEDEWYLHFATFRECQTGLRWEREPESELPPPPAENDAETIRKYSGILPEEIRIPSGELPAEVKRREEKRREENNAGDDNLPEIADPASAPKNGNPAKRKSAEAAVPSALAQDLTLYHAIWDAMISENGDKFTAYDRQGKACKEICVKCRDRFPDDEQAQIDFAQAMLEAFRREKSNGNKYIRAQPFTPVALNTLTVWDQILETLRVSMPDPKLEQIIKGESRDES